MTCAVVNSTWQKRPKYEFTTHLVQRSIPVLNKRDGLKTVTVDVLYGIVEARDVRGSSPLRCVLYALSSCLLHRLRNAVYIKRSYPSPRVSTLCILS